MSWLDRERLTVYPRLVVACYLMLWGFSIITGSGIHDRFGKPVGADFPHYWLASALALAGDPAAVYDHAGMLSLERACFGPKTILPWLYPPTFLFIIYPLALLPYVASLLTWLGSTLAGFLLVLRRIAPHRLTIWLALAFPGTFINLIYGQNGFLSAMLLGGGLWCVDRRPWVAGMLFGLLTYKPHLSFLVFVALLAGRRWPALGAMMLTALGLVLASLLVLGNAAWVAFGRGLPVYAKIMESGAFPLGDLHFPLFLDQMPTVFCALRLAGVGFPTASVLQSLVMLLVTLAVAWVWFRGAFLPIRGATLVLGILLFTPYAAFYDLTLLALPLALLGWEGYLGGLQPLEETWLILGFWAPLLCPLVAHLTGVQLAPIIFGALFLITLRRGGFLSPGRHLSAS